jgi:hypothetical protein
LYTGCGHTSREPARIEVKVERAKAAENNMLERVREGRKRHLSDGSKFCGLLMYSVTLVSYT